VCGLQDEMDRYVKDKGWLCVPFAQAALRDEVCCAQHGR
jgi:hypothetical protein